MINDHHYIYIFTQLNYYTFIRRHMDEDNLNLLNVKLHFLSLTEHEC